MNRHYTHLTNEERDIIAVLWARVQGPARLHGLRGVKKALLRKAITYDNGPENVEHILINQTLGTHSYFCEPYHSWEKGSVEHAIGLIRRYLPKKTDFAIITAKQLKQIEDLVNNRPRKVLNYRTPHEVFNESAALALC